MEAVIAVGFILGLSVLLAVVLAVAQKKLKVFEDPRIDKVVDMLPSSNCGACGLPGCRAFAEKTVLGEISPSQCTVGGPDSAQIIADYLGIDPGCAEKNTARLLCAGGSDVAVQIAEYRGHPTCRDAAVVTGGGKGCTYGCLGLADCEVACTFDAIKMSVTGLPVVDSEKCTACNDCVEICPLRLFVILPLKQKLLVQCKSELEGDVVLETCKVGCTACSRCAADAPEGLIAMKRNLPVIDPDLIHRQTPTATLRCPTDSIVWIEGQQFPRFSRDGKTAGPARDTLTEVDHVV